MGLLTYLRNRFVGPSKLAQQHADDRKKIDQVVSELQEEVKGIKEYAGELQEYNDPFAEMLRRMRRIRWDGTLVPAKTGVSGTKS